MLLHEHHAGYDDTHTRVRTRAHRHTQTQTQTHSRSGCGLHMYAHSYVSYCCFSVSCVCVCLNWPTDRLTQSATVGRVRVCVYAVSTNLLHLATQRGRVGDQHTDARCGGSSRKSTVDTQGGSRFKWLNQPPVCLFLPVRSPVRQSARPCSMRFNWFRLGSTLHPLFVLPPCAVSLFCYLACSLPSRPLGAIETRIATGARRSRAGQLQTGSRPTILQFLSMWPTAPPSLRLPLHPNPLRAQPTGRSPGGGAISLPPTDSRRSAPRGFVPPGALV